MSKITLLAFFKNTRRCKHYRDGQPQIGCTVFKCTFLKLLNLACDGVSVTSHMRAHDGTRFTPTALNIHLGKLFHSLIRSSAIFFFCHTHTKTTTHHAWCYILALSISLRSFNKTGKVQTCKFPSVPQVQCLLLRTPNTPLPEDNVPRYP